VVEQAQRVQLGHAVRLVGLGHPEPVHDLLEEPVASAACHADPTRAQRPPRPPPDVWMTDDGDRHGVHRVPDRDALPLHQVEGDARLEGVHEHEAAAVRERRLRDAEAAPRAGQRQRVQHAILRAQPEHAARVPPVRHRVPVGHDRALRERGRARRVEDRERVVGAEEGARPDERGLQIVVVGVAEYVGQAEAAGVRIVGVHDHAREAGEVGGAERPRLGVRELGKHLTERLEVVHGSEMVGEQEGGGVRLAQDVRELVGLVAGVEGDHHRAGQRTAVLGEEPLGPIRQPDGHGLAAADAEPDQRAGEALRLAPEGRVGDTTVGRDDRLALGPARRRHGEEIRRRRVDERVGRGHAPDDTPASGGRCREGLQRLTLDGVPAIVSQTPGRRRARPCPRPWPS
jgi:hypothetical protein